MSAPAAAIASTGFCRAQASSEGLGSRPSTRACSIGFLAPAAGSIPSVAESPSAGREILGRPASASSSTRRMGLINGRRTASFARHRRSRSTTGAGSSAGSSLHGGSASRMARTSSVRDFPVKARSPVTSSKSTQPKAQTSVRQPASSPHTCSGLM